MKGSALYPVSPVSFPTQVGKLVLVGTLLQPSGVSPQGIVKPLQAVPYCTVLGDLHAGSLRRRPAEVRRAVGVAWVEIVFLMRYSAQS